MLLSCCRYLYHMIKIVTACFNILTIHACMHHVTIMRIGMNFYFRICDGMAALQNYPSDSSSRCEGMQSPAFYLQ